MCAGTEQRWFMKEPCKHCPFRRDVPPFLHPDRAHTIAHSTSNPYNEFPCHKTTESDDEGESYTVATSLTCAGFLAMQISESGRRTPQGFEPSDLVYSDAWEMSEAYEEAWGDRGLSR